MYATTGVQGAAEEPRHVLVHGRIVHLRRRPALDDPTVVPVVFQPPAHVAEPGGYCPVMCADPANTFHEKAMLCLAAENTCYSASVNCASEGSGTTSAIVLPDGTVAVFSKLRTGEPARGGFGTEHGNRSARLAVSNLADVGTL